MHDKFDIHPFDLDSLAEIAALTDLMIAAADSRVDRLTSDEIDRILHIGGTAVAVKGPWAGCPRG